MVDVGQWLIEQRADMDRAEAVWLQQLAEFDRDGWWALDGQLSCVAWLVWRTNMARSTAFEKLRVAHELQRRPIVAEAFRQGRLSYSAVRALTRLDRPDPDVDEALVELAQSGQASILDLERVVRSYGLYADQERPPARRSRSGPGRQDPPGRRWHRPDNRHTGRPRGRGVRRRPPSLPGPALPASGCGRVFSRRHPRREAPIDQPSRAAQKANAFMDLVRTALEHADGGRAAGDDRYLVHVVTRDGGRSISQLDGTPLHPADAALIKCDTSTVTHTVTDDGEPLHLGRKTREWSTTQRRAITVRDAGQCRFVGCTSSTATSTTCTRGKPEETPTSTTASAAAPATTACSTTATVSKATPTANCASIAPTAATSDQRIRPSPGYRLLRGRSNRYKPVDE